MPLIAKETFFWIGVFIPWYESRRIGSTWFYQVLLELNTGSSGSDSFNFERSQTVKFTVCMPWLFVNDRLRVFDFFCDFFKNRNGPKRSCCCLWLTVRNVCHSQYVHEHVLKLKDQLYSGHLEILSILIEFIIDYWGKLKWPVRFF